MKSTNNKKKYAIEIADHNYIQDNSDVEQSLLMETLKLREIKKCLKFLNY